MNAMAPLFSLIRISIKAAFLCMCACVRNNVIKIHLDLQIGWRQKPKSQVTMWNDECDLIENINFAFYD